MNGFNREIVYLIAKKEFFKALSHPLIIVISSILFILAILNGAGSSHLLPYFENDKNMNGQDVFIKVGLSQVLYTSSLFCTVTSIFIGIISISEERSKNSIYVLLTKPLYRKDVITGKFLGLNAFIILLVSFNFVICSLLIMLFFRGPNSYPDFFLRLFSYVFITFLLCSLIICITMLIGIVIKNLLAGLAVTVTYFYIDWYCNLIQYLGKLAIISPRYLYLCMFSGDFRAELLDTTLPYSDWVFASMPYIILILLSIIVILLLNCLLFTMTEEK